MLVYLAIMLVLLYTNHSTLLKLSSRKPSGSFNVPTTPLPTTSTDSDSIRNKLDHPVALASFTSNDVSVHLAREVWRNNTNKNLI